MARPRSALIEIARTPYYHCISRCVRRSYLCGEDDYSGKCFDHRKEWLIERIKLLGEVFAIDIAAYAVMSNHYHLVLHVNKAVTDEWSRDEIVQRWLRIYKGPELAQRFSTGALLTEAEMHLLDQLVEVWRKRLSSISWFMARLNEYIARRANQEDDCKGRFWEGRFTSRGLEDLTALLSCMAYVDLNPVRAGIAHTLTDSDFTSIQQRIQEFDLDRQQKSKGRPNRKLQRAITNKPRLMSFSNSNKKRETTAAVPFSFESYVELVEISGRSVRKDKKGYIPARVPIALSALHITQEQWLTLSLEIQKKSICMLNGLDKLAAMAKRVSNSVKPA